MTETLRAYKTFLNTGVPEHLSPQAAYNLLEIDGGLLDPIEVRDPVVGMQGLVVYRAARPRFGSNFTRDAHEAAMLATAERKPMLRSQIAYNAHYQAAGPNPVNGAERGKMHHEMPGAVLDRDPDLETTYNGCDTTAAWMKSVGSLALLGDRDLLSIYRDELREAEKYIFSHIGEDSLFFEDPALAGGADRFALKVTFWKDSELNTTDGTQPKYPIVYTLPHFQNADALLTLGKALGSKGLINLGLTMTEAGVERLWQRDHFVTAIAAEGAVVDPMSSDSLHSLMFIDPGVMPAGYAQKIVKHSSPLITAAGYMPGIPARPDQDHNYHTAAGVWAQENAKIHLGLGRYGLHDYQHIPARVAPFIDGRYPEILTPEGHPISNALQLWVIAAHEYLKNPAASLYVRANLAAMG